MKASNHPHKKILLIKVSLLVFFALLALKVRVDAQVVPPGTNNPSCLVYNVRETGSTTGYQSFSYNNNHILVMGPQTPTATTNWDDSGIDLATRTLKGFFTYTASNRKKYYQPSWIAQSQFDGGVRAIGLLNMARSNVARPTFLLAVVNTGNEGVYPVSVLGDSDLIGTPALRAPNRGSQPIWLANTLVSSFRSYDLNADRIYTDEMPTSDKYLGQNNQPRRAALNTGKTTYTFNPALTELVKSNQTLEAALTTVENWLKSPAGGRYEPELFQ